MSSIYKGKHIDLSIFGESHGKAIGGTVNGLPYGTVLDLEYVNKMMQRRRPSNYKNTTTRRESDEVEVLSGLNDNLILTSPLSFIIKNKDQHSKDYNEFYNKPRPSHIDLVASQVFGNAFDLNGSGHSSGRLTASLTFIGGICKYILEEKGIQIYSHIYKTMGFTDTKLSDVLDKQKLDNIAKNEYPIIDGGKIDFFNDIVTKARNSKDSLGAIVETEVYGLPMGIGSPMFDGIENNLSKMLFSIPAVKGIEFGSGFDGALTLGSINNDGYYMDNGEVKFYSNNSGGILGGFSSGEPINFKLAFKPTPSIARTQKSVNLDIEENEDIEVIGRHDPMIAIRAIPVVEAVTAIVVLDFLLDNRDF